MKRVTASEARRDWFRLLDEVVAGEQVIVERKGCRIVLRRESRDESGAAADYSDVFAVRDPESADTWGWDWDGSGLRPAKKAVRRK